MQFMDMLFGGGKKGGAGLGAAQSELSAMTQRAPSRAERSQPLGVSPAEAGMLEKTGQKGQPSGAFAASPMGQSMAQPGIDDPDFWDRFAEVMQDGGNVAIADFMGALGESQQEKVRQLSPPQYFRGSVGPAENPGFANLARLASGLRRL